MYLTQAKIANFNIISSIKEDVIWSQVAMYDSLSMYVSQALYNLAKQMPRQFLVKVIVRFKHLPQCPANK